MIANYYHCSVKYISRNQGRSAVSAAAYRSGQNLYNGYDGLAYDFTRRNGVVCSEILLPENSPSDYYDREKLWNAVEKSEKRVDARTAREIEIALPLELNHEQQLALVRDFVSDNFVSQGMGADIALHDGKHRHRRDKLNQEAQHDSGIKKDNPHAHILLTTRPITPDGLSPKKNRDWDKRENVLMWRENWAAAQNKAFERMGLDIQVDHRSYAERGLAKEPTKHEGVNVREMEKRGLKTERGEHNRQVRQKNEDGESRAKSPQMPIFASKTSYAPEGRQILGKLKDLQDTAAAIREFEQKIADLTAKAKQDGADRNYINDQIKLVENSKQQATQKLNRDHAVTPERSSDKIQELQRQAEQFKRAEPEQTKQENKPPTREPEPPRRESERNLSRSR